MVGRWWSYARLMKYCAVVWDTLVLFQMVSGDVSMVKFLSSRDGRDVL